MSEDQTMMDELRGLARSFGRRDGEAGTPHRGGRLFKSPSARVAYNEAFEVAVVGQKCGAAPDPDADPGDENDWTPAEKADVGERMNTVRDRYDKEIADIRQKHAAACSAYDRRIEHLERGYDLEHEVAEKTEADVKALGERLTESCASLGSAQEEIRETMAKGARALAKRIERLEEQGDRHAKEIDRHDAKLRATVGPTGDEEPPPMIEQLTRRIDVAENDLRLLVRRLAEGAGRVLDGLGDVFRDRGGK